MSPKKLPPHTQPELHKSDTTMHAAPTKAKAAPPYSQTANLVFKKTIDKHMTIMIEVFPRVKTLVTLVYWKPSKTKKFPW
eukprot:CAMPEP_0202425572 /NCGR_PEP_ID=MMETSP1345-20130828/190_1 /ASSEMBLY_ACC=CAM_ASM_000843 /TAXON_ID=342563 /ORGANISM="Fabrea Fabrea salina" /LENGTH=79 /DNA_ID=CAMNT_0049035831 /DNA_START=415 /DNA_END=651 /DNA_ORIENTATION=-